jgi:predicted O-methyltransferase YrrM
MKNVLGEAFDVALKSVGTLAPDVGAMCGHRYRAFLNHLASQVPPAEAYLEIGIHIGGTLISALIGNKTVTAYACDNWSFKQSLTGNPKAEFMSNWTRNLAKLPPIDIRDMSCWELLKNPGFSKPIGMYFYDAGHSEEDQYKAVMEAFPYLAKTSIVVIDDFNWPDVRKGTARALAALLPKLKSVDYRSVRTLKDGDSEWWDGVGAFFLEKE